VVWCPQAEFDGIYKLDSWKADLLYTVRQALENEDVDLA